MQLLSQLSTASTVALRPAYSPLHNIALRLNDWFDLNQKSKRRPRR